MRRLLPAVTAALLAAVVVAAPASAAREPTPDERAALIADTGWVDGCVERIAVSTVDPSWAAIRGTWEDSACGRLEGLTSVVQRKAGGWERRAGGLTLDRETACEQIGVPGAAGRDLGVCSPASRERYIPCATGRTVQLRIRPARCGNALPEVALSDTWVLRDVRWSRWGGRTAVGRGLAVPVHRDPLTPARPIWIRATQVSWECGAAQPVYRSVTLRGEVWRPTVRPSGTDDVRVITVPAFTRTWRTLLPYRCVYEGG